MTPLACSCGGTFICTRVLPIGSGSQLSYEFRCACGQAIKVACVRGVDPAGILAMHLAGARARAQAGGAFGVPPAHVGEREPPAGPAKLTAKVIGFRAWSLEGYKLISGAGEWRIGVNTAECKRELFEGLCGPPHPGEAPQHSCTCGLYGWYDAAFFTQGTPGPYVYGAITAWGHIEAQPRGFRAQYAEPVVLAYHEEQSYRHVRDLKAIASEMGVACVALEELEAEALKHGQPIPREMIPKGADMALSSVVLAGGSVFPMRAGGAVLPAPPTPKPTASARLPYRLNASFAASNLILGIIYGNLVSFGAAGLCAALALICHRSYRRRWRLAQ